jgi:hypothetical protein
VENFANLDLTVAKYSFQALPPIEPCIFVHRVKFSQLSANFFAPEGIRRSIGKQFYEPAILHDEKMTD